MWRLLLVVLVVLVAVLAWKRPRGTERRAVKQAPEVAVEAPEVVGAAKPGPVGGRVLPARRARVHYYDYGDGDAPLLTVDSLDDGTFRFPESVGERGVLLAEADGFRPSWFAMRDFNQAMLALEPGGPLPYRVTDPEGNPIPGAEVEVWHLFSLSGHYTRIRLATDSDGVVEVAAGPEERFTITAEGFEPQTIPHPDRAADDRFRTFVLVPRLRIRGRVVDPAGHPVAGVVVRYRKDGDGRSFRIESSEARVDADARFETPPLRAQPYEIQATAPGWAEARAAAWPGASDVVLRVDRPARIEGRVLLPGGAPVASVELWIDGADPTAETASDGSFALEGLPPGRGTLRAYWWGPAGVAGAPDETTWRCCWPLPELKPGESRSGIELTLSGAFYSWVPLRLVSAQGVPLAGAPVDTGTLSVLGEEDPTTDENGFVLIRTEDAAGYETRFEFPAEATGLPVDYSCRIVTLPPGTTDVIEIKLPVPVRVTFVVRDGNGAPIPPEASPTVHVDIAPEHVFGDRIDVLVVSDDEDPRVDYYVSADGFAKVSVEDWVPNPAGETIEIRMQPAAVLRGAVTAADGKPLGGLRVACGAYTVETTETGKFWLDWLEPGPVLLRVAAPESSLPLIRRPLELSAGVNDIGVLKAPAPETVRGRVTDASGEPVGGATIELLEPGRESRVLATTRPDGSFFLRVYESGAIRVMARRPGFGAAIAEEADLSMTLPAEGTLRLRVPPEIFGETVRIALPDGSEIRPVYGGWESDTLCLEQLPPGPLSIDFLDEDDRVTASCNDRATVIPRR